jgi:multiple sugar transport system permease protein
MGDTPLAVTKTAPTIGALSGIQGFWKKYGASYLFLMPFFVLFTIFFFVPIVSAMVLSFTYFNVLQPPRWIGLNNYINLFLSDDVFIIGVQNTIRFAIYTGPIGFIVSFLFAWLITSTGRARVTYTLIYYAPSISGGMLGIWMLIFSGDRYGILNYILTTMGILNEPYLWTKNPDSVMGVIIFVSFWMSMGTGFLAQMAGLQSIPQEVYESGKIDGLPTRWHELWYLTLPMAKPYLLVSAVLQVVAAFSNSAVAQAVAGFPSVLYAGHTVSAHLMDFAFLRFELGYSSAISMVLFLATFGINRLLVKVLKS